MRKKSLYARKCATRPAKDASSIYRVMSRIQPFTEDEIASLLVPVQLSFEKLRNGIGDWDDYQTIRAAANIVMVRAKEIGSDCVAIVKPAANALVRCKVRFEKMGRWGLDGPAMSELADMICLYQQMLELSTPLQIKQAMKETLRLIDQGEVVA